MRQPFGLTENPRRNPQIDFLRGFSIFVVLFTHFGGACGPFSESLLISARLVKGLGQNSYYGVSLFFVISGFLITSTTKSSSCCATRAMHHWADWSACRL